MKNSSISTLSHSSYRLLYKKAVCKKVLIWRAKKESLSVTHMIFMKFWAKSVESQKSIEDLKMILSIKPTILQKKFYQ